MAYNKEEKIKSLNRMQYEVTQNNGTEPPFQNEYWDHKEEGLYVDIVSGKPLFTSKINLIPNAAGQALQSRLKKKWKKNWTRATA